MLFGLFFSKFYINCPIIITSKIEHNDHQPIKVLFDPKVNFIARKIMYQTVCDPKLKK